jgi:exopolysaccharide biosynthesis predicted pyruvyltransferase EpsI
VPYQEIKVQDLLGPLAGRDVALVPNNGNVGDALIHAATLQVLERMGVACRIVSGDERQRGDVLLLGGGGNLVDRYGHLLPRLERLHDRFEDVVVLPHTIFGRRVAHVFARLGPNVRVVCRERHSYDFLSDVVAHRERLFLSHDMAFHFDYGPYRADGAGTLNAFRLDVDDPQLQAQRLTLLQQRLPRRENPHRVFRHQPEQLGRRCHATPLHQTPPE